MKNLLKVGIALLVTAAMAFTVFAAPPMANVVIRHQDTLLTLRVYQVGDTEGVTFTRTTDPIDVEEEIGPGPYRVEFYWDWEPVDGVIYQRVGNDWVKIAASHPYPEPSDDNPGDLPNTPRNVYLDSMEGLFWAVAQPPEMSAGALPSIGEVPAGSVGMAVPEGVHAFLWDEPANAEFTRWDNGGDVEAMSFPGPYVGGVTYRWVQRDVIVTNTDGVVVFANQMPPLPTGETYPYDPQLRIPGPGAYRVSLDWVPE